MTPVTEFDEERLRRALHLIGDEAGQEGERVMPAARVPRWQQRGDVERAPVLSAGAKEGQGAADRPVPGAVRYRGRGGAALRSRASGQRSCSYAGSVRKSA